jgi:hypothetical protein
LETYSRLTRCRRPPPPLAWKPIERRCTLVDVRLQRTSARQVPRGTPGAICQLHRPPPLALVVNASRTILRLRFLAVPEHAVFGAAVTRITIPTASSDLLTMAWSAMPFAPPDQACPGSASSPSM